MILIRYYGAPRGSFENSNNIEFSASACQKIHSELLASVNQIYVNLQDSGLKTTSSSSSSSLSAGNKLKMQKTGSVDLKPPDTLIKEKQREVNQRARYKILKLAFKVLVTQVFRFHLLVPIHLLHLRSSSIAEINLKKKLRDEEINKLEKSPLASSKQKQKQKKFANANAGKIEVIVKSKTKLKNSKQKLKDREP